MTLPLDSYFSPGKTLKWSSALKYLSLPFRFWGPGTFFSIINKAFVSLKKKVLLILFFSPCTNLVLSTKKHNLVDRNGSSCGRTQTCLEMQCLWLELRRERKHEIFHTFKYCFVYLCKKKIKSLISLLYRENYCLYFNMFVSFAYAISHFSFDICLSINFK